MSKVQGFFRNGDIDRYSKQIDGDETLLAIWRFNPEEHDEIHCGPDNGGWSCQALVCFICWPCTCPLMLGKRASVELLKSLVSRYALVMTNRTMYRFIDDADAGDPHQQGNPEAKDSNIDLRGIPAAIKAPVAKAMLTELGAPKILNSNADPVAASGMGDTHVLNNTFAGKFRTGICMAVPVKEKEVELYDHRRKIRTSHPVGGINEWLIIPVTASELESTLQLIGQAQMALGGPNHDCEAGIEGVTKGKLLTGGATQPVMVAVQPVQPVVAAQPVVLVAPQQMERDDDPAAITEKLRSLKAMLDEGLISEADFEEKKKVLLSRV
jgi:hypothetical protein